MAEYFKVRFCDHCKRETRHFQRFTEKEVEYFVCEFCKYPTMVPKNGDTP